MGLRSLVVLGLMLAAPWPTALAAKPDPSAGAWAPDPATVERQGPAYRYPKAGWIVVHVEGEPYDRGYQQGRLLAPEIADYAHTLAVKRSPKDPAAAWRGLRTLVNALFLRRYDREYIEEMKGIADGAAAGGARFDGRPIDLIDVVALNSEIEAEFLDGALRATADGLEGRRFPLPEDTSPAPTPPEHCSAFAATGPATADGKVVFGHITMFSLPFVRFFNVWLDVKPARGHRVVMQTYPGGIMSGMDYYLNGAGLIVTETTIAQTKFDAGGEALASRIRKALQYAGSIDEVVATLKASNNGMYTNEWLIADTKTDEIAMFELGTHKSRLWRSGKKEWFGGTEGFYWGCNNTKDLEVRLETVPSPEGRPANVVFHPSDRDRTWLRLYGKHKGEIAEGFGFEAFGTAPLAAFPSCDAKFTTSAMARELKTWALYGPPLGRTWEPTQQDRDRCPTVRPLVSNDWTILTTDAPPAAGPPSGGRPIAEARAEERLREDVAFRKLSEELSQAKNRLARMRQVARSVSDPALRASARKLQSLQEQVDAYRAERVATLARGSDRPDAGRAPVAVDLATSPKREEGGSSLGEHPAELAPAWRGTILPGADADLWLAAAFADYEPVVARELAMRKKTGRAGLPRRDRERIGLDLFAAHARYKTALRRGGRDIPLAQIRPDLERDEWYGIASGKGVLLLAELRTRLGDEAFLKLMDDFGRAHAGRPATTKEFRQAVAAAGKEKVGPSLLDRWLNEPGLPEARFSGTWSISSFLAEPERALIVYGTLKERHAQREAAELLGHQIARIWSNATVPIRSDAEVDEEALASHHVLLIGRPDSNAIAAKYAAKALPVAFGPASFSVGGESFAHPDSALIAAGDNPLSPRYELVVFAGLSARSTRGCVSHLSAEPPSEVLILASGSKPRHLAVTEVGTGRPSRPAKPRDGR